ncbi:hybrid sensor histidine kinase/response regulator [Pelobium manganitolerans]|uniref:Sensory/regulatory protein RpfC n=1 Tax=Pelobium manganitolerans TaxID=1842495 RepID=A0A419SC66_9SPHI|nr:response regulator [Pelobium manganitolerans]RKD20283.1 hybrid sensor histidine kinase/response regulator [Pelobium manganitolerans]
MSNPLDPDYESLRLEALESYQILDTLPEKTFDRFTELAALICGTPISLVSLLDEKRQWFKSRHGLEVEQTDRKIAFCHYAIQGKEIMEVSNATLDKRFAANPLVTDAPNIKFYAGCPLIDTNGFALGTLCVIDQQPRALNDNQKKALSLLGQAVTDLIVRQRKQQKAENFDKLFALSKDLICVFNANGQFKTLNPAFNTLLGWSQDTLSTLSFYDLLHPADVEDTKNTLQKLSDQSNTVSFSHRLKAADNSYRILKWTATREPATNDFFAIARDITEEREKEIRLHNSELRLRAFFENSTGFMCTHDLDGKILTVNTAGAKSLGYTPNELIGKTLYTIIPEDRYEYMKLYLAAIKTQGAVHGMMYTMHRETGEVLTWLFNNVLQKDADGDVYVIGNAVDITERHRLEADLQRTQEMMIRTNGVAKIGAWEVDMTSEEIFWSKTTRKLHEVDDDFIPNMENALAFFGEHAETVSIALKRAVEDGETYDLELPVTTAKGKMLWVRTLGTPEFKDGKCVRLYGTFQDITENYLHRVALKTAKIQAERANVAKSEFLASMSHEIRTPLNGVIGFTDLVLKTALNQTQQQYLTIVHQSANALLAIINDILDFSKIEAGKLELDIEKADLFELTSQASDIITFQAQKKGLEVLLNIDPNLPRFAEIDAIRLKQVLINLLGNAVKFTEKGEIELKISADSDPRQEYVDLHFEVRDTGIGIQEDKQNKIFEAFSQEDASTTKKYGGTGLGLTISNRLLGLMGSQLQLKSKVGQGSTFFFKLRLKTEDGDSNLADDISFIKEVLVVDDNENNRLILKQMLLLKNIKVSEAKNGLEALQLLTEGKHFDVVLMDYHMPYMDGLETIQKIRQSFASHPEDLPIMLLHSSSDDEKIIKICEENGVNLRMVKPIKMQELYGKLAKLHAPKTTLEEYPQPEKSANKKDYKILVVEDNLVNKLLAKTVISRILPNANIIEASNGEEGVAAYQTENPDLILMDLQMPVMNGYEAATKIRALENGREKEACVTIVALTAGNVKGEREKCLEMGMDDFVTKPFVEEDLAELFSRWLVNEEENCEEKQEPEPQVTQHFNTEKLKEFMGDDVESTRLVLSITIDELYKADQQLKALVASPNVKEISALGHKLFGTASGTGLEFMANIARDLESIETVDEKQLVSLYTLLHKEIVLVNDLIQEHLQRLESQKLN